MRKFLASISLLFLCVFSQSLMAQASFPDRVGARAKYAASIELKKGYVSGICVLLREEEGVRGCLFNEFGISALDFVYYPEKGKVRLESVMKMLDKWYIRKVLRKDLVRLMENLQQGTDTYRNEKFNINYKFSLLKEDATEK